MQWGGTRIGRRALVPYAVSRFGGEIIIVGFWRGKKRKNEIKGIDRMV
jgi:hypothetical protein